MFPNVVYLKNNIVYLFHLRQEVALENPQGHQIRYRKCILESLYHHCLVVCLGECELATGE